MCHNKYGIPTVMNWKTLHHPDLCLPVVRRKTADELLTLLAGTAELVLTRGASCIYRGCYPSDSAYNAAVRRLEKNGLLACSPSDGSLPTLTLTSASINRLPDYLHPERHWSKRWNKWWYILMFDVPECQRSYRDTLRAFLKNKRFGCLQKSVWVTPQDVRADYHDLDKGASVDSVAFLFEARTVLGYGNQSVVMEAWDFDRLNAIQNLYIDTANENLDTLTNHSFSHNDLLQLLRMDALSYSQAMTLDPLLPAELHPKDYAGLQAFMAHQKLIQKITTQGNLHINSRS
jgi:phenylacetic acid degradation operon negative regulatory protein